MPLLLWVLERGSVQVATHVRLKRDVKEYSRTLSASSVVIVKQLAQAVIFGAPVGKGKAKQWHEQELMLHPDHTCRIKLLRIVSWPRSMPLVV